MKLSETEMNVVHANTQTLTDDLVESSATSPPVPVPTTNGNKDATANDAPTTDNHNHNNNNKLNKLNDNLDSNINNNTAVSSSSNIKSNISSTSKNTASLDETDRSATPVTNTSATTPNSNNNESVLKPVIDLVNNNNSKPETTSETSKTPAAAAESISNNNQPSVAVEGVPVAAPAVGQKQAANGDVNASDATTTSESQEATEVVAPGKSMPTPEQSAAIQSLINYNEGQWSPHNPTGKKQYDREQLMLLREAKASRISPDVSTINASILPQPNLLPSFMRGNNNNKRVQSMSGIGSMGDRSGMGAGNMGGQGYAKQASMSGVNQRNSTKGNKAATYYINLSLNQDVKLNETDNAWKPRVLVQESTVDVIAHDSEDLKRRVRGILNKLTPEKFDTLVEQIIKLKIDTNEKVNDVTELVFEKAIDEPNFSARLCQRLVDEVKARDTMESDTRANLKQFRTSLLNKTENEFTENVTNRDAKERKLQPILDKIRDCKDQTEKLELKAQLEEEERKIRRRSGGTVRFIGELFKISMLTGKIIHSCIDALLDPKSEDKLECLCMLLITVGEKFEKTPYQGMKPSRLHNLDATMKRMQAIASKSTKDGAKVSSRVRFMLQDVIDLRQSKWVSNRGDTPKTMEEIQKQTKTEEVDKKKTHLAERCFNSKISTGVHSRGGSAHGSRESSSSRNNQGRGMMNASSMQKSASHNKNPYQPMAPRMQGKSGLPQSSSMSSASSHQQSQQQSSSQHMNSNASSSSQSSAPATASATEFESPAVAPPAVFDEPTNAEQNLIKSAISEMVELAANSNSLSQVVPYLTKFKDNYRSYFLFMILAEYLHLANVRQVQRRYAANIVAYFFKRNFLTLDHFKLAYKNFCALANDIVLDVPSMWVYIFEFSGPLLAKKVISAKDLWNKELAGQKPPLGVKFLKTFLVYCTCEIGPEFTRAMWKNSNLYWTDFVPEAEVANFIKTNKFEFIENASIKPTITVTEDKSRLCEKVVERVEHMLKDGAQSEPVIDYINGNIVDVDKQFIRPLTTAICNFAITYKDNTYKLDTAVYQKVCIPILARVIESNEQRELECLYAMQLLCNRLEHPRALLSELYGELYDADVVQQETFLKWRDSKEELFAGKGVAVKGLNQFFNQLMNGETSDEAN